MTGSAYNHNPYFKEDAIKIKMIKIIQFCCWKFNWQIDAWVILDDHYHIMLQASADGDKTIKDIIQNFHKFSSMWIRKNYSEYNPAQPILSTLQSTVLNYLQAALY